MPASEGSLISDSDPRDAVDQRLLVEVAEGRVHAFETLYKNYFPRLSRFLGAIGRNDTMIEEVINDAMLVVWNKACTFDRRCKVATWIFAIAFRTAKQALRRLDLPLDTDFDVIEGDAEHGPERQCELHEMRQAIAVALAALPPMQRAVICLTYEHRLGYTEVAQILDCPVNTVKTRVFHARRRLKTLLAEGKEMAQ